MKKRGIAKSNSSFFHAAGGGLGSGRPTARGRRFCHCEPVRTLARQSASPRLLLSAASGGGRRPGVRPPYGTKAISCFSASTRAGTPKGRMQRGVAWPAERLTMVTVLIITDPPCYTVGTSLACPAFGTNAICRRQIRRRTRSDRLSAIVCFANADKHGLSLRR